MGEASNKIRHDIEETRGKMAETLDAIGYKVNVPARARDRSSQMRHSLKNKFTRAKEGMMDQMQDSRPAEQVMSGMGDRTRGRGMFARNNAVYVILGVTVVMALGGMLMRRGRSRLPSSD